MRVFMYIAKNPTHPLKNRRQITRIRNRLNKRDRMFFDLLINTGRRGCDIVDLKKKDLPKLNIETIFIKEKKTYKEIKMPINTILPELIEYTKDMNDNDYLFTSRKKDKNGNVNHITTKGMLLRIKEALVNENIQGTRGLHIFRKTFCYWLIYWNHGDIGLARLIMNHSSAKYTRYYAEWGWEQDEINRGMSKFKGFVPDGKRKRTS